MKTHNLIIVIGAYRVEVQPEESISYGSNNYWAQVIDSRGVLARFGKPIPAVKPASITRDAAIQEAINWVGKQPKQSS